MLTLFIVHIPEKFQKPEDDYSPLRPFLLFFRFFLRTRRFTNNRQNSKPNTPPQVSRHTSAKLLYRPGTNHWWNSSRAADTKTQPMINRYSILPRSSHGLHMRKSNVPIQAYSPKCASLRRGCSKYSAMPSMNCRLQ